MNKQIKYIINIAGTGILVILLLSIIFFWADKLWDSAVLDNTKQHNYDVTISPSGLIANEQSIEKEYAAKNEKYLPSGTIAFMNHNCSWVLGWLRDMEEEEAKLKNITLQVITDHGGTYYDESMGLFINYNLVKSSEGQKRWIKKINFYIGPEGISDKPGEQLGRFVRPLIKDDISHKKVVVFYDKGLRRFFRVKISDAEKSVTKGAELDSETYNPVKISYKAITKFDRNILSNGFREPYLFITQENGEKKRVADENSYTYASEKYLIVVNKNNIINLLDTETLELKYAGRLPIYTKQQYSYSITPVFLNGNYKGLTASTISSNFKYMDTFVFDATGEKVNDKESRLHEEKLPGGIASLLGKYIIESLQPAGFNILSYLTAHNYDGSKSQQAMFVRPNSFIAMFANDNNELFLIRLLVALVIMGPSLIIGVLLGWRVGKRAKALGMSRRVVRLWTYGVIFTGVAGYLTFRFTKHAEAMVTCKNCGQLRRVEQDNCHNCKTNWQMKHLENANWRILEA